MIDRKNTGAGYPAMQGRYVFGDFSTSFGAVDGRLYYLEEATPGVWRRQAFGLPGGLPLGRFVKGFGQDEAVEIYLLSTLSDVRKLVAP